jgi:uncharacterized membrane protein YdbT with pleckstrin-like domain
VTTEERNLVGRVDGDNLILRESWLNQFPLLIVFVVLEILASYVLIQFPEASTVDIEIFERVVKVSWVSFVPLLILGKAAFHVLNERLVLTPEYLIQVNGRLTWREKSTRLEYHHIQEIETEQTIFQRMLGIGDVTLKPIGGAPMRMVGLYNPREVKNVIRERVQNAEQQRGARTAGN